MGDEKLLKEIGARISARRKELHYTQEYVAEQMDVSIQMISNLELGKKAIRPENLVKVAAALDISTDYILTGSRACKTTSWLAAQILKLSDKDYHAIVTLVGSLTAK